VHRNARVRGVALAIAAGLANGFVAVASKAFAQKIDDDSFGSALLSWEPYLLLFSGITAVLQLQSAYQANTATVTFPLVEVTAPLTASFIGVAVFGEHLSLGGHRAPVVLLALIGVTSSFAVALLLVVVWAVIFAIEGPLRQAFINGVIPSEQRATVLSFDNLMGSAGAVIAQPALGRVADVNGYGASYVVAAGLQALAIPFLVLARRERAVSDPITEEADVAA